jgi:hypothetical protein
MNNVLANAETSITRFATDMAEAMALAGLATLEYVELDARSELRDAELPGGDIIGVTQFSITEDDKIFPIHFMIGVSTVGDLNLFRLRAITNFIFNRLQSGAELTYYDVAASELAGDAVAKSWIRVLPGSTLLPTSRVETRPFRFVQVQALLDPLQSNPQA